MAFLRSLEVFKEVVKLAEKHGNIHKYIKGLNEKDKVSFFEKLKAHGIEITSSEYDAGKTINPKQREDSYEWRRKRVRTDSAKHA